MNLRGMVNGVTRAVNPNIQGFLSRSSGWTIGAGGKQVPAYADPEPVSVQMQALDAKDIQQLDSLNIQGTIRAAYIHGHASGVVRPTQAGGDLITIGDESWLVVRVLESWPDWTKAAVVLQ